MHAHILEILLEPIQKRLSTNTTCQVLTIACGSGYIIGALARILDSHVIGLESRKRMYENSVANLKKDMTQSGEYNLTSRAKVYHCDGRRGWPVDSTVATYAAIYVAGAVSEVPQPLRDQLHVGGRFNTG